MTIDVHRSRWRLWSRALGGLHLLALDECGSRRRDRERVDRHEDAHRRGWPHDDGGGDQRDQGRQEGSKPRSSNWPHDLGPNAAGWYKTAVVEHASPPAMAALGSPRRVPPPSARTSASEGDAVKIPSGACADAVGNSNPGIDSAAFKIDLTAPTVDCGSADGLWHANDVSIACSASDELSGLGVSGNSSFSLSTTVGADVETSNASTGSRDVSDVAGNTSTAGPIAGNMVDKKKPSISCGSADGNWHNVDVTIGCTASDGGSASRTRPMQAST